LLLNCFFLKKNQNTFVETYGNMIRLPKYVRKALAEEKRLITEETPLYICDL